MDKMTQHEKDTLALILRGKEPICLHALGQGLVNHLASIIRKVENNRQRTLCYLPTPLADKQDELL